MAIFDLLREMDDVTLTPDEKKEMQDSAKHLIGLLNPDDRAVVKQHAYELSSSRKKKANAEAAASQHAATVEEQPVSPPPVEQAAVTEEVAEPAAVDAPPIPVVAQQVPPAEEAPVAEVEASTPPPVTVSEADIDTVPISESDVETIPVVQEEVVPPPLDQVEPGVLEDIDIVPDDDLTGPIDEVEIEDDVDWTGPVDVTEIETGEERTEPVDEAEILGQAEAQPEEPSLLEEEEDALDLDDLVEAIENDESMDFGDLDMSLGEEELFELEDPVATFDQETPTGPQEEAAPVESDPPSDEINTAEHIPAAGSIGFVSPGEAPIDDEDFDTLEVETPIDFEALRAKKAAEQAETGEDSFENIPLAPPKAVKPAPVDEDIDTLEVERPKEIERNEPPAADVDTLEVECPPAVAAPSKAGQDLDTNPVERPPEVLTGQPPAADSAKTAEPAPVEEPPIQLETEDHVDLDEHLSAQEGLDLEHPPMEDPEPEPEAALDEPAIEPEDKLTLARASKDPNKLATLIYEPEDIQLALLANPALNERLVAAMARKAGHRVADAIHKNRRFFTRPMVRSALLDSPHAPSAALLEIVNSTTDLGGLVKLIKNPKVKHMEVKAKARHRLATTFKSLSSGEKVAAIRRQGRNLLKELWSDFFRNESLVLQCLRDKQLDSGIVLEIARSKIAPRRAMELIGNTPAWASNYPICLALVENPKTPRQVVGKLIRRLSPSDRRRIKNNRSMPDYIRKMA